MQIPYIFEQGTKAMPDEVNENFDYCLEQMQILIDKFDTKDATTDSKIASMKNQILEIVKYDLVPVGTILMWGPATVPTNYIAMTGQNDLSNYPKLQELGYTSLPDTRNRTPWGSDSNGAFNTIEAGLPNHSHNMGGQVAQGNQAYGGRCQLGYDNGTGFYSNRGGYYTGGAEGNAIYGRSSTVQPPAFTTVFIIKYQ